MNECKWITRDFDCCKDCDTCYCDNCKNERIKNEANQAPHICAPNPNNLPRILVECWHWKMNNRLVGKSQLKDSEGNYKKLAQVMSEIKNESHLDHVFTQMSKLVKEHKELRPAEEYYMPLSCPIDGVMQIFFIVDEPDDYDAIKEIYDFIASKRKGKIKHGRKESDDGA